MLNKPDRPQITVILGGFAGAVVIFNLDLASLVPKDKLGGLVGGHLDRFTLPLNDRGFSMIDLSMRLDGAKDNVLFDL